MNNTNNDTPAPDDRNDRFWTPNELASRYSYSNVKAFMTMAREERIPMVHLNARVIRFDIEAVKAWEKKRAA